jgi:hypothetical protein
MKQTAAISFLLAALAVGALAQSQSSVTSLSKKACRELKADAKDNVLYRGRCPGVGGYKLEILAGEEHEYIELITPAGRHFDVGINPVSYSFLGKTVEWRTRAGKPYALIIPYNLRRPDNGRSTTSLVVSKISARSACVTDVVEPSRNQSVKAHKLAESAASRPCRAT